MVIQIRVIHVRQKSWKVVFTLTRLEAGADYYLTKPFEMEELKMPIHHIFEGRKNSGKNSQQVANKSVESVPISSAVLLSRLSLEEETRN